MPVVGRLAPTTSGHLHLGNAMAFGMAWLSTRSAGGRLLLRFEDVDRQRARPEIETSQRVDLDWLGLTVDEERPPQCERDYTPWLAALSDRTYRCTCTRSQIRRTGGAYTGTCRDAGHAEGALRFRLQDQVETYYDRRFGSQRARALDFGDPVLQRRDGVVTYNLAVVADDIADGVTEVVRGADLLGYTAVQIQLWEAFGATPPTWLHGPLLRHRDGRKLSKSHGSTEIRSLRAAGHTPQHIWQLLLSWLDLPGDALDQAVSSFSPTAGRLGPIEVPAQLAPIET